MKYPQNSLLFFVQKQSLVTLSVLVFHLVVSVLRKQKSYRFYMKLALSKTYRSRLCLIWLILVGAKGMIFSKVHIGIQEVLLFCFVL